MSDLTDRLRDEHGNEWPLRLNIRDTQLHDDLGGGGQRIYTTAGRGYRTVEYVRADAFDASAKRIEALEAEVEHFTKSGIVEIAVRNSSVSDYMAHWEGRTERAEAELIALRQRVKEVLEPFAKYETPEAGNGLFQLPDECDVLFNGTGEDCAAVITLGHFRAARALHDELTQETT